MHKIADILFGFVIVTGIMVMVRPGSQGPTLVKNLTSGFGTIASAASGGGTF